MIVGVLVPIGLAILVIFAVLLPRDPRCIACRRVLMGDDVLVCSGECASKYLDRRLKR